MKCKAAPYQGEEAFAFFSYCHADSAVVYPLIEELSLVSVEFQSFSSVSA